MTKFIGESLRKLTTRKLSWS